MLAVKRIDLFDVRNIARVDALHAQGLFFNRTILVLHFDGRDPIQEFRHLFALGAALRIQVLDRDRFVLSSALFLQIRRHRRLELFPQLLRADQHLVADEHDRMLHQFFFPNPTVDQGLAQGLQVFLFRHIFDREVRCDVWEILLEHPKDIFLNGCFLVAGKAPVVEIV